MPAIYHILAVLVGGVLLPYLTGWGSLLYGIVYFVFGYARPAQIINFHLCAIHVLL